MAKKAPKNEHPCQCNGECMCGGTCKEEVTSDVVIKKIAEVADLLDAEGYHKEAMVYDEIMVKIAQHQMMQEDWNEEHEKQHHWKPDFAQTENIGECFNCGKPMELYDENGEKSLSDSNGNSYCCDGCFNEMKRHVPQWFGEESYDGIDHYGEF